MRNDFYVGIYEDRYLAHHGIDGMKWGVQNGPPYPLDRQTHNRVVRRAKRDARKGNKWATSSYQPSSVRASLAAGNYAASRHQAQTSYTKLRRDFWNKVNEADAKKLDKLNDQDAIRWEAARKEYKKLQNPTTPKEYNRRIKDLKKNIRISENKRARSYTKIRDNGGLPMWNKKHARRIDEYTSKINKDQEEISRLLAKAEKKGYTVKRGKVY